MPEFTQEQINAMLESARKEAVKGMLTEDEVNRRVTAEVDRRVNSGIEKGIETQKAKWIAEYEKTSKLTAEELAQQKIKEEKDKILAKEREINRKSNLIEAKEMLSSAQIEKDKYDKIIGTLVSDDLELTKANIQSFIDVFNTTKQDLETKIKSTLTNVKPPASTGSGEEVTLESFKKMSYSEKIKFKTEHPEEFKKFMK